MTAIVTHTPGDAHLSMIDKIVLLAALAIAVALFLSVGWMAIAPDDPQGAVSLSTHSGAAWMVIQVAALAAIASAIASVMIGTKLVDVGVFAAAAGMAFVSLRGDTAAYLLINVAQGDHSAERSVAARCAVEAGLWSALLLLAAAVSGVVLKWCFGKSDGTRAMLGTMFVGECPYLANVVGVERAGKSRAVGLRTLATTSIVAAFLYKVFVSGSSPRAIEHGQVCFAVVAAFYIAVWIAKRTFPPKTPFWTLTSVPLVAIAGYGWAAMRGRPAGLSSQLANLPGSDFLRALPITFVAAGAIGVLLAHWSVADSPPSREEPSRRPQAQKRRRA